MPAEKVGRPDADAEHHRPPGTFEKDVHPKRQALKAPAPSGADRGFVNWMFRSRKNGRITLAQLPNWPLGVWLLASVVMWVGHPKGRVGDSLSFLASAALALWSADELLRGVNPFRRLLGAAVLTSLVFSVMPRLTA